MIPTDHKRDLQLLSNKTNQTPPVLPPAALHTVPCTSLKAQLRCVCEELKQPELCFLAVRTL